jgi:hypothetical protein
MTERRPRRSGFRRVRASATRPPDPETLFKDLRKSPGIQYLWSHQADILRKYDEDYPNKRDVALELPTGTGKTLIGLLIAEYRRRKFDERALYLCPTRQLAWQVGDHARAYGIEARVLLPREYEGINDFHLGNAVGVSTYSAIFNTNPRIEEPKTVVLDDAHAAEDYIASLWSVRISRQKMGTLYRRCLRLLEPELEEAFVEGMLDDGASPDVRARVDMLPHPRFSERAGEIRGLLDQVLDEGADERYPWSMIRGHLHACCLFVSWQELLLRPLVPPTLTHPPFESANQRVYMSATLGEGGELERITGVPRIERIPAPKGWDKQGSGRRLFLFPNLSMGDGDVEEATALAAKESGRALALTPTAAAASIVRERFSSRGMTVLSSGDVGESLEPFTSRTNVALVLANRYDGIDLPDEACRLLIMEGLPAATNLQERFLLTRLGADSLLRDRLRTRFTQGAGRCCRNDSDFAVVLAVGQRLFDFCAKRENRSGMHPELQAELEYGIENSYDLDHEGLLELVRLFHEQGEEADAADQDIRDLREEARKVSDPVAGALMEAASKEVSFVYDLWRKDYAGALEKANGVSDALSGGRETAGYRAWWHYLAGSAAWMAGQERDDQELLAKARDLFGRAARASKSISWFAELSREVDPGARPSSSDVRAARACESVFVALSKLGFHGKRFDREMAELTDLIGKDDSSSFERGLEILGRLLGFDSSRPSAEDGAPDGVWLLDERLAIAFEAKSDEGPNGPIAINAVRQSSTHSSWVRNNRHISADAEIVTVLVTPRTSVKENAAQNAGDIYYVNIDELRELAERLEATLRRIRSRVSGSEREAAVEVIREEFDGAAMLPTALLGLLKGKPLQSLLLSG